jgi:hypothetical protein
VLLQTQDLDGQADHEAEAEMTTFGDLFEVFDKSQKWMKNGSDKWGDYENHFYHFHIGRKKKERFDVVVGHSGTTAKVDFGSQHSMNDRTGRHPRDAHRVIGTVKDIVSHHVEQHKHLTHVQFSAYKGDGGREKLYRHIAKSISGGTHTETTAKDHTGNEKATFTVPITRPK